jgi:K+-sensing histidine kinase KdpD
MAAIITSTPSSYADSINQPRLRLVAGHSNHRATAATSEQSPKTAVLACLTAGGPSNSKLLHSASRAAREQNGGFYAVVVSPRARFGKMELRTLVNDTVLASRLGAKILWLDASDVTGGLLRLADQFHIGRIFVLRHQPTPLSWLLGRTVYSGLLSRAEGIRVDVVGFERGN